MLKRCIVLLIIVLTIMGCLGSPIARPDFEDYSGFKSQVTSISETGYSVEILGSDPSLTGIDIADMPIPAYIEEGKTWQLQENLSDDFKYDWTPEFDSNYPETPIDDSLIETFGPDEAKQMWYNSFQKPWHGPGVTYYQYDHVTVEKDNLVLFASRNEDTQKGADLGITGTDEGIEQRGVNSTCITSSEMLIYPVFVEAKVSVANIALSSNVWFLSEDLWQEIDILECYGGMPWFEKNIHISYHLFKRSDDFESLDFEDYQPRDKESWWSSNEVDSWGSFCRDQGEGRRYVHAGMNWISPVHLEYYINGELVRVIYDRAIATKVNGQWKYTYPTMTDGKLDQMSGYQRMVEFEKNRDIFSFETLYAASLESTVSVIDPLDLQPKDAGLSKEMNIIINFEAQEWNAMEGRTPNDTDLADETKNHMMVDWIRVYKPVIE